MDYPFQIVCVQPPPPLRKNQRRGVCGGGGVCSQASLRRADNPFLALVWKQPMTKFPCPVFLIIAKDCTERLSPVALSLGLIIPRGECVSGDVVRARFFSQICHRNCLEQEGRRLTGTRHGNVYCSVREKQWIVVYRQRVLQTVTYLCVLFH